jgi:putative salt-induced outer membrane protein YdiY
MPRRIWIALVLGACAASARADTLVLANGDKISGEIVEWALESVVLEHPQLGRIRLSLDQLAIDTGKPPSPGLFGTGFLRGWSRNVNLGWNGEVGNDNSTNIVAGFNFNFEDPFKRWLFTGRYFFNTSDDDNDNNATVDLRRDWLVPGSPWFSFATFRFQFDQFESWKFRNTFSAGPGYNLLRTDDQKHVLDTRLGVTYTREYGDRSRNKGEALVAFDYTWTFSKRQKLTFSNQFFLEAVPSAGEFRNLSLGEWTVLLARKPSMNFKIGFSNEYETDIDPGDTRNDLKYYMALGLDF